MLLPEESHILTLYFCNLFQFISIMYSFFHRLGTLNSSEKFWRVLLFGIIFFSNICFDQFFYCKLNRKYNFFIIYHSLSSLSMIRKSFLKVISVDLKFENKISILISFSLVSVFSKDVISVILQCLFSGATYILFCYTHICKIILQFSSFSFWNLACFNRF